MSFVRAFIPPAPGAADRDRVASAFGVAVIHALLAYALLWGLGMPASRKVVESLKLIDILPTPVPPPPEKIIPARAKSPRRQGAASPRNLKSKASEIVAPIPLIRIAVPPPVIAAPVPRLGNDPSAGASTLPGPGAGSGGQGNGTGSGLSGDGDGGGGGGSPLRWLSGRLKDSDYPRRALDAGIGGTVYLRFVVGVKGRVTDCSVTRSSGSTDLDQTTCRLIKQRFRYRPKRDASGKPVPTVVTGEHEWFIYDQPPSGPPVEEVG